VTDEGDDAPAPIGRVLVIDDAFGSDIPWYMDQARWEVFVRTLGRGDEPPLDDIAVGEYLSKDEDRAEALGEIEKAVDPPVYAEAMSAARGEPDTLRLWVERLQALGAEVVTASDVTAVERLAPDGEFAIFILSFDLILLDYEFLPGDGGNASTLIAGRLGESVMSSDGVPPMLIKFSRIDVELTEQERAAFTAAVRYPRGCYEFVAKSIVNDPDTFATLVSGVVASGKVGRKLFATAQSIKKALVTEVESGVAEMLVLQVDSAGLRLMFGDRLRAEGMSELDWLIEITTNLLANRVRASKDVAREMTAFVDALGERRPGEPAETSGLVELEIALRTDSSPNEFRRPIDFGDVFLFHDSTVAILLTPQCDLMVRGSGSVATELLTMRLGQRQSPASAGTRFRDATGALWSAEWGSDVVAVPRSLLDLVTLRNDGRARIERDADEFPYWTEAYRAFIADQLAKVRGTASTRQDGSVQSMRIGTAGQAPNDLGATMDLAVDAEGFLPLQRLCRLRYAEALALLQDSLAKASRVGLMPDLDETVSTETVKLYLGNTILGQLACRVTTVGSHIVVDVETGPLRALIGAHPEYANVVRATAGNESRFDLKDGTTSAAFRLIPIGSGPGRSWDLKPPRATGANR
jgi:CheY-like chemotaxis protein